MSESKHTPGPWTHSGDGIWAVSPWNARVRLATVTTFADMNGIDSLANARLIAAAPDLLIKLRAAREIIASLPEDALGMNSEGVGDTPGLMRSWPIRDEALHYIDAALSQATPTDKGDEA